MQSPHDHRAQKSRGFVSARLRRASGVLSMADIVNLNKARKAKAKAGKEQKAQENRVVFGRTKSEKRRDAEVKQKAERDLSGKLRDDPKES
jgi:hypothetical protein